jgi:hypothetical protein
MKHWCWSILPLMLAGCLLDHGEVSSETIDHTNEPEVVSDTAMPLFDPGPPIDINELKRQAWLETTSGVLGKQGAAGLCPKDPNTFFGFYFLIDRSQAVGPIGRLTISKPHAPKLWRDDDQDENFVQLELSSGRIKMWDMVAVGDHEDDLMAFLGDNFSHRKGSYIVAQVGNYYGEFNMQNDAIRELKVRKTCDQQ